MSTKIISNGSGSIGPIDDLVQRLQNEPLDRKFERFGNFFYAAASPSKGFGKQSAGFNGTPHNSPVGEVHFFGNFLHTSHVFNIATTDRPLMRQLSKLIRANQKRPDYLVQAKPNRTPTP